jgi:hypothetical protein
MEPQPKSEKRGRERTENSPGKPSGSPAKKRRRKAAPVPLDSRGHPLETRGRRTPPLPGKRAPPPSRLTAARSPSRCSRTPATGPEGRRPRAASTTVSAGQRKGREEKRKRKGGGGKPGRRRRQGSGRRLFPLGRPAPFFLSGAQPPASERGKGTGGKIARVFGSVGQGRFDPAELVAGPSDRIRRLGRSVGCCHGPWAAKDRAAERAADRVGRTRRWRAVGRQLRQKRMFFLCLFSRK